MNDTFILSDIVAEYLCVTDHYLKGAVVQSAELNDARGITAKVTNICDYKGYEEITISFGELILMLWERGKNDK